MSESGVIVHVGSPPEDHLPLGDIKFIQFHDFENLPRERGVEVESPEFECAGYKWKLIIYPGGDEESDDGFITVYLQSTTPDEFECGYEISLKRFGDSLRIGDLKKIDSDFFCFTPIDYTCRHDFEVSEVMDDPDRYIEEGSLTFAVSIRLNPETSFLVNAMQQQGTIDNLQKAFLQNSDADFAFKVKGRTIPAHRVILRCFAPELAELSETFDMKNPMPIDGVEPDIFEMMLKTVYGAKITNEEWKAHSQNLLPILAAADRFGFSDLKTVAEIWYTNFLNLDVDNVVDNLLHADANNLPQMKKAAIEFLVENASEIVASDSYMRLDESPHLRREVTKEMADKYSALKKRKRN